MICYKNIHLIGINGVGMYAIARILAQSSAKISGSDIDKNLKSQNLIDAGIEFFQGHHANNLPDNCDLVIFSSAIKSDNPELLKAKELNIKTIRRGEFLVELASSYKKVIAISGSHGKTTVCSMLAHLCLKHQLDIGYLIGGEPNGFEPFRKGNGDIFITEADESDGTHTFLQSDIGIITNISDDHSWSVNGEKQLLQNFNTFCKNSKTLIMPQKSASSLLDKHKDLHLISEDDITKIFNLQGFFKINGALALEGAKILGIDAKISDLDDFQGVKRRMTLHDSTQNFTLIEDYAHHPTELKASLEFLKIKYPNSHIRVVFQPHRYARLAKYFNDFVDILSQQNSVVILPVFAAWNEKGKVDSIDLTKAVDKAEFYEGNYQEIAESIVKNNPLDKDVVIAIIGAGDLNKLIPFLI